MFVRALTLSALVLGAALPAFATPADDVNASLKAFSDAFTKGDAKAAMAQTTEDFDFINPLGQTFKTRAEAEKAVSGDLATMLKGTTSKFTMTNARELAPNVWLVDATHDVANFHTPDGKVGSMRFHNVFIFTKGKDGKVLMSAARTFAPLPPPPAGAPAPAAATPAPPAKPKH